MKTVKIPFTYARVPNGEPLKFGDLYDWNGSWLPVTIGNETDHLAVEPYVYIRLKQDLVSCIMRGLIRAFVWCLSFRFVEIPLRTLMMTCILMTSTMFFIGLISLVNGDSVERVQQMLSVTPRTIALFVLLLIPGYISQRNLV